MSASPASALANAITEIEDVSSRIEDVFARVGQQLGTQTQETADELGELIGRGAERAVRRRGAVKSRPRHHAPIELVLHRSLSACEIRGRYSRGARGHERAARWDDR